jgi:hypothetical protein
MPITAAVLRARQCVALAARSFTVDFEFDVVCDRPLADFQTFASSAKNQMPTSRQIQISEVAYVGPRAYHSFSPPYSRLCNGLHRIYHFRSCRLYDSRPAPNINDF